MLRSQYYEALKNLARETRTGYGIASVRVLRSDLRRIYSDQGIRIDLWDHKLKNLRGAYFNDELGPTVMLSKGLPEDPMVFTMAHELKHHLADSSLSVSYCDYSNQTEPIEIGAEVFAAELIYPEFQFASDMQARGITIGGCTPELIVRLKRETRTTLSYAGLVTLDCSRWNTSKGNLYRPPVTPLFEYARWLVRQKKHSVRIRCIA
jgi:Zn-dependent peptidase ImmA (M78 family)